MPRVVDHDVQREEVLLATMRTLAAHGPRGTTVRRIAAEAGVSTGFITHYFRDKGEVLAQALRLCNERSQERVAARLEGLEGLDAVRALIGAVLPLDEDRLLTWKIWLSFWGRSGGDEPLGREQRRGRESWRAALRRLLGDAQRAGAIRPDLDPAYEAERLVVLVGGIGLQSQTRGARSFRRKAWAYVEDHLESLMAPAPGADPAFSPDTHRVDTGESP
jgi:AcrR family transcriptional regulator